MRSGIVKSRFVVASAVIYGISRALERGGIDIGSAIARERTKKVANTLLRFDAAGRPTNLRLVFLGDSTCRHLFLSLSYYLHSGGNHINFCNASRRLITGHFPTRTDYDQYILDSYNGTLACDCYTPPGPFIPWGRTHMIWQNIYYYDGLNGNQSENDGNFLTHLTKPGYFEAHGHWEASQIYANLTYTESVRAEKYPVGKFRWAGNWEETIRTYIARIVPKPDYVVINAGLWPHDLNETVFEKIRDALDDHDMVGIYKTTNKKMDEYTTDLEPHDATGCRVLHHCLNLSWTGLIRDEHEYLDKSHFGPNVNVNFTVQFLRLLRKISTK